MSSRQNHRHRFRNGFQVIDVGLRMDHLDDVVTRRFRANVGETVPKPSYLNQVCILRFVSGFSKWTPGCKISEGSMKPHQFKVSCQ